MEIGSFVTRFPRGGLDVRSDTRSVISMKYRGICCREHPMALLRCGAWQQSYLVGLRVRNTRLMCGATRLTQRYPTASKCWWTGRNTSHTTYATIQERVGEDVQGKMIVKHEFVLQRGSVVNVFVSKENDGSQEIEIYCNLPGRLLLHWGIERGSNGNKKGWSIPSKDVWPVETLEYKRRALQTPFQRHGGTNGLGQTVKIRLPESENAESLLFVLKNQESNEWYDLNGSNFYISLNQIEQDRNLHSTERHHTNASSKQETKAGIRIHPEKDRNAKQIIGQIPGELAGVWAYMRWEAAGYPNRSQEESDREYQSALRELEWLLQKGISLESIQDVADKGYQNYSSFISKIKSEELAEATEDMVPELKEKDGNQKFEDIMSSIPDDLVGVQAYLLWESAGKPEGADLSLEARENIAAEILNGKSIEEIRMALCKTSDNVESNDQNKHKGPVAAAKDHAAVDEVQHFQPIEIQSFDFQRRNPLDLIHRSSPPQLAEKKQRKETPLSPLVNSAAEDEQCVWNRLYPLGEKSQLLVAVRPDDPSDENSPVKITFTSDTSADLVLHLGVKYAGKRGSWHKPPKTIIPTIGTFVNDGKAAEIPFQMCEEEECEVEFGGATVPLQRTSLSLPGGHGLTAVTFVLRSEDNTRWWKDGDSNFSIPVPGPKKLDTKDQSLAFEDEISRIIVDAEVNSGAWTLMHRFNKAAELLDGIVNGNLGSQRDALARIYVWLRYSATRQLTWQRNYNTQPRILGSAQERLTMKITEAHAKLSGPAQEWARMCLTTVGRGSNAQAVRDEILNIMHRNKIPEVKGTWMEEFHQKLHNNTTPDDVEICEAYIAFLKSDGNLGAYWGTLSDAGINRARLESFDRPIMTEPIFYQEKKDALITDFTNYLGILKATHSGADLNASISAAAPWIPSEARSYLGYVLSHSSDDNVLPLIEAAVEARTEIAKRLPPSSSGEYQANRELLYLDLALEDVIRSAAERGAGSMRGYSSTLIGPLIQNLAMSVSDNEEICYCLKAWMELPESITGGCQGNIPRDDALKAAAVFDRIRRVLASRVDFIEAEIGAVSTSYGQAFGCEPWSIELFTQEVIRGGPAFAVSLALSALEPTIRFAADLGSWQVISPGSTIGRLKIFPSLYDIQDKVFDEPTVLLAYRVTGEEEVPLGAVAVISGDSPDVLSHLAVRSRNLRVLFSACYDEDELESMSKHSGCPIEISTTSAGAVRWRTVEESMMTKQNDCLNNSYDSFSESASDNVNQNSKNGSLSIESKAVSWCGKWSLGMDSFASGHVGAKSKNLASLRGRLPTWIQLPPSTTVPFGSFEKILGYPENAGVALELEREVAKLNGTHHVSHHLSVCRDLASSVKIPSDVEKEIRNGMINANILVPELGSKEWDMAMNSLRAVWASKFNDRAFYSTRKMGIDSNSISMAVLIQAVVPARYAFVIHTTNPTNGDESEIYCELVAGLGEAIVSGSVPGTALTFVTKKNDLENPSILLYPSKSEGFFVPDGSLIFRSDSNGEDLDGYAGAGLYDSITTAKQQKRIVDYSADQIVVDSNFRKLLLSKISTTGAEIERSIGTAQDIEGVVDTEGRIFVVQTRPQM